MLTFLFLLTIHQEFKAADYQFDRLYLENGYSDPHKALKESEEYFKRELSLPTQLPPVTFTHHFGRLSHSFGKASDVFELVYLNKDVAQNHYSIRVKPVTYKIEFTQEKIDKKFTLADGSEAVFSTSVDGFHLLVFEKNDWQYILSIDRRLSDQVTEEVLLEIANSIK